MPRSPRADPLNISQLLLSFRVLQGVQPHRERLLGFARLTHLLPGQRNLHVRLPHVAATGPEGVITAVVGRTPEIVVCTIHRRERCPRSEEHTSELQSLMRISYAVFCLKKK